MNLQELEKLAKTDQEQALLIAWEQKPNHSLQNRITDPETIVRLSRSHHQQVACWAHDKIQQMSFTDSLKALKFLTDGGEPWGSVLFRTLKETKTIEQFKRLAPLISSCNQVSLFSTGIQILKQEFTKAKSKQQLLRLLNYVKYLHDLSFKLHSIYGEQFSFEEYWNWRKKIHQELFNLMKSSKKELVAIVFDDKYGMKDEFAEPARAALAKM